MQPQTPAKSKKPIIILAVILVLAIAISAAVYVATRPATVEGAKSITVIIDNGQEAQSFTINTDEEYLADALLAEELVQGDVSEFGLYILTANGTTADENLEQWWLITKNGEGLEEGVSSTAISDGDQYEITLTTGW